MVNFYFFISQAVQNGLHCRASGNFSVESDPVQNLREQTKGSRVRGSEFSFRIPVSFPDRSNVTDLIWESLSSNNGRLFILRGHTTLILLYLLNCLRKGSCQVGGDCKDSELEISISSTFDPLDKNNFIFCLTICHC